LIDKGNPGSFLGESVSIYLTPKHDEKTINFHKSSRNPYENY
jgi:hypothetical protein